MNKAISYICGKRSEYNLHGDRSRTEFLPWRNITWRKTDIVFLSDLKCEKAAKTWLNIFWIHPFHVSCDLCKYWGRIWLYCELNNIFFINAVFKIWGVSHFQPGSIHANLVNFLSNISQWPCNGAKTVELYLKLNFLRDEYLFGLVTVTSTDLLGKSTENLKT